MHACVRGVELGGECLSLTEWASLPSQAAQPRVPHGAHPPAPQLHPFPIHLPLHASRLMLGGMREGTVGRRRPGKPQAPGAELGVAPDLFQAQVSAPAAQGRAGGAQRQAGGSVAADIAAAQASPLTVMEGGLLDLGTSCPAATLALGLAHLQTDDAAAAARFAMPGGGDVERDW